MIPVRVRGRRPDLGTGCSSAWPEHLPRTEEVLGSNPSAQTNTTVALVSVAARDAVDVKARVRFPAPPQTKRCWCSTAASLTSTQRVSVRLRCTAPSDGPLAAQEPCFSGRRTWVRIPPVAPKREKPRAKHSSCGGLNLAQRHHKYQNLDLVIGRNSEN